jgi:hypothetical protein
LEVRASWIPRSRRREGQDRVIYDTNSEGEAAPHTDWISVTSLNAMCKNFGKFNVRRENIGATFQEKKARICSKLYGLGFAASTCTRRRRSEVTKRPRRQLVLRHSTTSSILIMMGRRLCNPAGTVDVHVAQAYDIEAVSRMKGAGPSPRRQSVTA